MSVSPRVAIIVDNPRRDLRGSALLAYQLAKRGAEAFLVPMYQQGYDIPLIVPDLVVVNYARENNRALLECYQDLGVRVAVLDTEGGVLSESGLDSPNNWADAFRDTGLEDLVDFYCFWGREVYNTFKQNTFMDGANMALTGCPRYDLCNPPWSSVLTNPLSNFILVNTNFSAINPAFTHSDAEEERLFCEQGWDPSYVKHLFAELRCVLPRFLDAVEAIANVNPRKIVQIRPHPFENENVYLERFSKVPNVIINSEGDIFNAIHGAECVVHLNCGSSVDAVRMGKVPVSMEFLNTELMRRHAPLPSRISCKAANLDDLLGLVFESSLRANRYSLSKAQQEIEPWYHLNDGQAAERVANFLFSGLANTASKSRRSMSAAIRGGRRRPSWHQYFLGIFSFIFGSRIASILIDRLKSSRRGKHIYPNAIYELISQYRELDCGPLITVERLRNPIAGQPLSSFRIRIS